jgi:hypothetical protein
LLSQNRRAGTESDRTFLVDELSEEKDKLLVALKEIEFDHRTGKLSEDDFRKLDSEYRVRAVETLRRIEDLGSGSDEDPLAAVEADVRTALGAVPQAGPRACVGCGERITNSNRFCSNCGHPVRLAEA